MDDSFINPTLLSSSDHLENVEQLIKNLEKQTLDLDNFDDILSNRNRQDIITKSFSSVLSSTMGIDDIPDDNFLVKSISLTNTDGARNRRDNENLSMDSLLNQRDLFDNDDVKKQQTPPANDQSLSIDHEAGFTWDDQYDTRANYRLTFSTDKLQQNDLKTDKAHRHKHHHHHHHHRKHRTSSQSNSTYSDDASSPPTGNNMNDWSMRSSFNALEQSIEQRNNKPPPPPPPAVANHQQASFIRSQSNPVSFSPQQQLPNNNNNNNSPNSSTTSSSSSASWKRMKESQRTTSGIETKETRPPSPLSLYKIFQQKSQVNSSSSSSPRSAFQYYRHQTDSIVPNNTDSMTISGEKMIAEKPKSSYYQRRQTRIDRPSSQTYSSTDQAIQTSIILDSSPNSQMNSRFQSTPTPTHKSESYDYLSTHTGSNSSHHLTVPSQQSSAPISSSSIHKSLPDLAFISQYSKELPRSRTTSPLPPTASSSTNTTNTATSPTIIQQQQKQEAERPRTLKSIKRYKNSKHSTEPLGVFYSPQLRKTFAAVPASAVLNGSNEAPKILKMKLPPPSSYPVGPQQYQTSNLKSCLKYGSRANSCDIQVMLQDRKSPVPTFTIPEPIISKDSSSPTTKRRSSEADLLSNTHTIGSSNDLNSYVSQDFPREHRSDYDLNSLQQQNQTKKSVSFSENIAKLLISPCNPAIKFDPSPEVFSDDNDLPPNNDLAMILHGNKENSTKKLTSRYGEMRRCQTDIIVVDRIHHLHSFTESPPNEFRLQETDSLAPEHEDEDDQSIMDKTHVNIIPNLDEPIQTLPKTDESNPTIEKMTSSNDKENKIPNQSINMNVSTTTISNPTNDPSLDGILERISDIVKRIFEIKRSEKAFFLTNENNTQLDTLLKNDLCATLQNILEHGMKPRKDLPLSKPTNLWKIIEASIDHGLTLSVFNEAKQAAQIASSYWVYQFQAFIYILLNKNELINWLYYYMKQKEILQRYYQPPDALILVHTSSTFTLFDRLMAQLEKLSPLAFRLVYKPAAIPSNIDEQFNTSTIGIQPTKTSARDWVMTISRRTSKTLTQPIVQPTAASTPTQPTDTIRSTLSRKINSLFTKTNPTPLQRKPSSAVTAKLPTPKPQTTRLASPTPTATRRSRTPNVFSNTTAAATTNKPVIVPSPKLNNGSRTGVMRRGISPSVVVAPSPPPAINTTGTIPSAASAFQSKIPRPSLNVDKPKSARYRSTAPPTK